MRKADCSCPCTGKTLTKFLNPAVLGTIARAKGGLHGYAIAASLEDSGLFGCQPPDATGLYRLLKSMEEEGLLKSKLDTPEKGLPKRVFNITSSGRKCLANWRETLHEYRKTIERLEVFLENPEGVSK